MGSAADLGVLTERGTPALLGHYLDPLYEVYPHVNLLSQKAVDLVDGTSPRQCWSIPPQHSKSETGARRLPLWFLDWFPRKKVAVASYGADLAHGHGRWIRNAIRDNEDKLRVKLTPDSRAAYRWNTPQGGGLLATGIGGSLTGFGADLLIIDDPFADWEAAQSDTERARVWNWYSTVARTRLQKGGSILVIQTRWHQEDLIGKLLAQDALGVGENWVYTRLPAIADHDPELGETDPLGRVPGQVLCPELHPLDEIHAAMRSAGPHLSGALYQQHPVPPEGNLFPADKWMELGEEARPRRKDFVAIVRAWDLAGTEGGGDYTVGALLGRHKDGRTFVLDVVRDRRNSAGVRSLILRTALRDRREFGRRVAIRLEQQPGSAGKDQAEVMKEEVLGDFVGVETVPSTGSKTVRATNYAAEVLEQLVYLMHWYEDADEPWDMDAYIEEHAGFPIGASHDDQVDASSLGFNELRKLAKFSRPIRLYSGEIDGDGEDLIDGTASGF